MGEGRRKGRLYLGGSGGLQLVQRGYFVPAFLFLFLFVSHFFEFLLMLSIYFADCIAAARSHASEIFGALVVRYFY